MTALKVGVVDQILGKMQLHEASLILAALPEAECRVGAQSHKSNSYIACSDGEQPSAGSQPPFIAQRRGQIVLNMRGGLSGNYFTKS